MKIKQISLIEPKEKEKGFFSIIKVPKIGLVILATILKNHGYNVKVFCESISPIDWDYVNESDICGVSYITPTANEAYLVSNRIMEKKIPIIHGGPHATILPEDSLKYCDIVVRGEGEKTILSLLDALNKNKPLEKIKGVSFKNNNNIIINNPPAESIDLDKLPSPDFSLVHNYTEKSFLNIYLRQGIILTSRGCPYNCEFCSVTKLFGRNYRQRSVKNIIKDIKAHLKVIKPKVFFFADDNFVVNKERTKELLKEMIKNNLNISFVSQLRADSVNDEELVQLMKKAGSSCVCIGFESVNQKTLDEYNKKQEIKEVINAIKLLKKYKIRIHGMFVLGSDSDKPDVVKNTLKFCLEHDIDTAQFFPLTASPGTDLTKRLAKQNRLIDVPWMCLGGQHVNIFSKNIKPSVLQEEIVKAYKKFYSLRRAIKYLLKRDFRQFNFLFFGNLLILRSELKPIKSYIGFLKKQEQGRYEGNKLIK